VQKASPPLILKKPQNPAASKAVSGVGVWQAEVPDHPWEDARPAWSACASKGRSSIARMRRPRWRTPSGNGTLKIAAMVGFGAELCGEW